MKCGNFEKIVCDLSDDRSPEQFVDAATRKAALDHAGKCERCATLLTEARELTSGLKMLARLDDAKEAPVSIEYALLTEFRKNAAVTESRQTRGPYHLGNLRWSWAAAAAILIAIGIIVYHSIQSGSQIPLKEDVTTTIPIGAPSPVAKHEVPPASKKSGLASQNTMRESRRSQRRTRRESSPKYFIRDEITAYATAPEFTSEFVPLDFGSSQTPMESGQIIRVQMPRPALVRFGLPVNVERADVPIKADLLVGEDGIARAIRFVR